MLGWLRTLLGGKADPAPRLDVVETFDGSKLDQAGRNDMVRAQLHQMGDSGQAERHVIHFAYPVKDSAATAAKVTDTHLLPFTVADAANGGLRFEETREVASAAFDQITQSLSDALALDGWDYDGWECAVVKDGES